MAFINENNYATRKCRREEIILLLQKMHVSLVTLYRSFAFSCVICLHLVMKQSGLAKWSRPRCRQQVLLLCVCVCVSAFYDYKSATALCSMPGVLLYILKVFLKFSNLAPIFFRCVCFAIYGRLNLLSYESQLGMRSFLEVSIFVSLLWVFQLKSRL